MSFAADLVSYLEGRAGITALVGSGSSSRIYPSKLKQGAILPAIRYESITGGSAESLSGATGTADEQYQIDAYAETRKQALALGEQIRLALQGYRGVMGATFVNSITLVDKQALYEQPPDGSDVGKHRVRLAFRIFHSEET